MKNYKGLILAAGLGTRLRPLTLHHAKPALPVIGIPSLWIPAWHLKKETGIEEFAVNISHAPESVRSAVSDSELRMKTGIQFYLSDETDGILGSSGALKKVESWSKDSNLCVSNGDSFCFFSWKKMTEMFEAKKLPFLLHLRRFKSSNEKFTNFNVDSSGQVLSLERKESSGVMFSGNYIVSAEIIKNLPTGIHDLKTSVLDPLLKEKKLFAYIEDCDWYDTGNVEAYYQTQFEVLRNLSKYGNLKELIEFKMKSPAPQVYIPKSWKEDSFEFKGSAIVDGDEQQWLKMSKNYGPGFLGIMAPKKKVRTSNSLVMEDHFIKFDTDFKIEK